MGFKDEIHIPVQSLHWAATQPDSVLSATEGFREIDKGDWNSGSAKYIQNPWQAHVVKRDVNRSLEVLMKGMNEELVYAIDQNFGMETEEWTDIDVYETMRWIVAQASSRFTVSLPMCECFSRFAEPVLTVQAETRNISRALLHLQTCSL
jgi:hypothetical protein